MRAQCEAAMRGIVAGTAWPDFLRNSQCVSHLRQLTEGGNGGQKKLSVNDIVAQAIYGFNYPNSFCHVGMHALLPPIRCFTVFKSPFFYPLSKVLSDLEHLAQVKTYTADEARQLYEKDIIMDDIVEIDAAFRAQCGL
ncbi:pv1h14035_P related protein [Babesia caballi]|uniref:Pv1h14035_P related protein n=1 Tax=Babesia caballi TaxID=5871 RepID=A0AAV4LLA2_BABCB|nr:pv1h14035_P related protein [Babesia caballi]